MGHGSPSFCWTSGDFRQAHSRQWRGLETVWAGDRGHVRCGEPQHRPCNKEASRGPWAVAEELIPQPGHKGLRVSQHHECCHPLSVGSAKARQTDLAFSFGRPRREPGSSGNSHILPMAWGGHLTGASFLHVKRKSQDEITGGAFSLGRKRMQPLSTTGLVSSVPCREVFLLPRPGDLETTQEPHLSCEPGHPCPPRRPSSCSPGHWCSPSRSP